MSKNRLLLKIAIVAILVLTFGIAVLTIPVQASPVTAQPANNTDLACNSCHDNLYYNYDLGKAYCVTSARTRCVDCHAGDPTTIDKGAAHSGMDAFPVTNGDDSLCRDCHQTESAAYVERFAQIAGFRSMNHVSNTDYAYAPPASATTPPQLPAAEDLSWPAKLWISLATVLLLAAGFLFSRFSR